MPGPCKSIQGHQGEGEWLETGGKLIAMFSTTCGVANSVLIIEPLCVAMYVASYAVQLVW